MPFALIKFSVCSYFVSPNLIKIALNALISNALTKNALNSFIIEHLT